MAYGLICLGSSKQLECHGISNITFAPEVSHFFRRKTNKNYKFYKPKRSCIHDSDFYFTMVQNSIKNNTFLPSAK